MPRVWAETVGEHREAVRDAIIDAAAALVAERGLRGLTMSEVAQRAGIGRATLYKYFGDADAILAAWHERQVHGHLAEVVALARRAGSAADRLAAVLERYALARHARHAPDLAAALHGGGHVAHAEHRLTALVRDLIAEGAARGEVRADVPPDELASYCLHAAAAAHELPSKAAVRRLARVTLDALRPPDGGAATLAGR